MGERKEPRSFINAHPGFELTGIVESNNDSKEDTPDRFIVRRGVMCQQDIELIIVNTPSFCILNMRRPSQERIY